MRQGVLQRPVKAFGRPVGNNRVGKTNRGGKRFGNIGHAKKKFRFGSAKKKAQVKRCVDAKTRAFVKAQFGARRIGGGMKRIRIPSRVQRMNWRRDCEAIAKHGGNFRFGSKGRFTKGRSKPNVGNFRFGAKGRFQDGMDGLVKAVEKKKEEERKQGLKKALDKIGSKIGSGFGF